MSARLTFVATTGCIGISVIISAWTYGLSIILSQNGRPNIQNMDSNSIKLPIQHGFLNMTTSKQHIDAQMHDRLFLESHKSMEEKNSLVWKTRPNNRQSSKITFATPRFHMPELLLTKREITTLINPLESSDMSRVVFFNREDGSVNFTRNWEEYKAGFGNKAGEFWLGLDRLHNVSNAGRYSLNVEFEDFDGNAYISIYKWFSVGSEREKYRLSVAGFLEEISNGGDSLFYHNNMAFSTYDNDNDKDKRHCAQLFGAWWHNACYHVNPMGSYFRGGQKKKGGINWQHAGRGRYSFKKMKFTLIGLSNV